MFRLLLLILISLWGVIQALIALDVPSSKRIHYSMMTNYGTQAVRMNQKQVVLGASSNVHTGYAYGPLNTNNRKDVKVYISSDVHTYVQEVQSTKNTPVFTAENLNTIATRNLATKNLATQNLATQNLIAQNLATQNLTAQNLATNTRENQLKTANVTKDGSISTATTTNLSEANTANTLSANAVTRARHLANLEKLSNQPVTLPTTASTTSPVLQNTIAFGFGVGARSLIHKLEEAQENVSEELAQSEESAKAHADITLRIPFAPQEIASANSNPQKETTFGIIQNQSLVFEAQANHAATGGQSQSNQSSEQKQQAGTSSNQGGSSPSDFEVALAAYPTPTPPTRSSTNSNQSIATNLTETSTTVVSGLEITLNPNAAVRRETPAEQQAFLWPLSTRGRLTSGYGNRLLAITNNHFHQGIDIAVKTGTPILAVKDGVVEKAGWEGSYGYAVYLRHNDGSETRYAHMSRIIVEKGEWVNQGQWLGLVGSTGLSTGPHLHFELHLSGNAVDPSKHLNFTGERLATR